jgi:hypothetical protein
MLVVIALFVVSTGGASEIETSTNVVVVPVLTTIASRVVWPRETLTFSYRASAKPLAAEVTTS